MNWTQKPTALLTRNVGAVLMAFGAKMRQCRLIIRFEAEGWSSVSANLASLAHGVYSTPDHIVVDRSVQSQ